MQINNNYATTFPSNIKKLENDIVAYKMNDCFSFKHSFYNPQAVQFGTISVDDLLDPSNFLYVNFFSKFSKWGYPSFTLKINDFNHYFFQIRKATPCEGYRIYQEICLGNLGHNDLKAIGKVIKLAQEHFVNLLLLFVRSDQTSVFYQVPVDILLLIINFKSQLEVLKNF